MALFVGRIEYRGADPVQVVYEDAKVIWIGPIFGDETPVGHLHSLGVAILAKVIGCGVREGAAAQWVQECVLPFDGVWTWRTEEIKDWWRTAFPPDQKRLVEA